jgi:RimJ/RimL family protein N-acetyltransferase
MTERKIPTITTERLTLRPWVLSDAPRLHELLSGDDVLKYFPNQTVPPLDRVEKFIERQLQHWQDHGYGWWAVTLTSSGELMGWVGLQFLPETNETEIAYMLGREYWGKGFATEAAAVGIRMGFAELGIETIVAIVHVENAASCHVAEKLGMGSRTRATYFGMESYRYSLDRSAFVTTG